ncbi:unnamed protein product, partial [Closterium sp. NIES-54]
GPAPSGVSQVDPAEPVEVAVDSGAESGGAEPAGVGTGGVESGGAEPTRAASGGALGVPSRQEPLSTQQLREWYSRHCQGAAGASGGAAGAGAAGRAAGTGGAAGASGGAAGAGAAGASGGAAGAGAAGGAAGARAAGGGAGAGATGGGACAGAAGGTAGASGATGASEVSAGAGAAGGATGAGAAGGGAGVSLTAGAGAAGGGAGAGAAGGTAGAGGAARASRGAAGAGAARGAAGAGAARGGADAGAAGGATCYSHNRLECAVRPRLYYVPLLQQVLGSPPSPGPPPPLLSPSHVQSLSRFQPASPLLGLSPCSGPTSGLTERREPESRPASPVRPVRAGRVPRPHLPPLPGTHSMTLRPSIAPQRVPLPSPPASSLPVSPDPASDSLRAASPAVTRFLATSVTDPLFESTAASALVTELVDFDAACRLDYAASLVTESASVSICLSSVGGECALGTDVLEERQEEFECFAASVAHLVSMLLAPEGDPDAPDIPTPRSYVEAIEGPYSSQWKAVMDDEMAS